MFVFNANENISLCLFELLIRRRNTLQRVPFVCNLVNEALNRGTYNRECSAVVVLFTFAFYSPPQLEGLLKACSRPPKRTVYTAEHNISSINNELWLC